MGIIERARSYIAEKARPHSRESLRASGVSLDEGGSISREGISSYQLFDLLRETPEMISILTAMADDVVQSGYEIKYLGDTSGERRRVEAERFYERHLKSDFYNAVIDHFATGDGYLYVNMVGDQELKSFVVDKVSERIDDPDIAAKTAAQLYSELKEKAPSGEPHSVDQVPSATVEHYINSYGDVTEYQQELRSAGETTSTDMDPERIAHFGYMKLNGGTYHFTPLRSAVSEITLLASAKDHNVKVHDNGGRYNLLFNLPNADPSSDHYKEMQKRVKEFRQLDNKYRDLVTTGEMEVTELNNLSEDMEFRELANYLTRVLVMAWGIPPARVGVSISSESGARQTSLMLKGYFNRIRRMQDDLAEELNKTIFRPFFNCEIELNDPDVQNEIKKAERDMKVTDVVSKQMSMGLIDRERALEMLDRAPEQAMDMGDEDDRALMQLAATINSGRDAQLSELEVFGDRATEELAQDQEDAQS
jgi:hypothetical protein